MSSSEQSSSLAGETEPVSAASVAPTRGEEFEKSASYKKDSVLSPSSKTILLCFSLSKNMITPVAAAPTGALV